MVCVHSRGNRENRKVSEVTTMNEESMKLAFWMKKDAIAGAR
jgi:hypothetical protein